MTDIRPKPGEMWKTREGGKAYIAAEIPPHLPGPVRFLHSRLLGWIDNGQGWEEWNWNVDGSCESGNEDLELIEKWEDKITISRSQVMDALVKTMKKEITFVDARGNRTPKGCDLLEDDWFQTFLKELGFEPY